MRLAIAWILYWLGLAAYGIGLYRPWQTLMLLSSDVQGTGNGPWRERKVDGTS